jgi:hypothetical protein
MPDNEITLRLRTPSGEIIEAPTVTGTLDHRYSLQITVPILGRREAVDRDYFECLLGLREQLEPLGYRFLVNGARRNAWPSGMARDMAAGRSAYLLELGKHDQRPAMVNIFEPADESDIAFVDEQRAFFNAWIGELPKRRV